MKKPWPSDVAIIIASIDGHQIKPSPQPHVVVYCRSCKSKLSASPQSIFRISNDELMMNINQPIDFFCIQCASEHDMKQVILKDDRETQSNN